VNFVIWKDNTVGFTAEVFDFDEFKPGGLHEKHAAAAAAACLREEGCMKKIV
jgi:hypothetical protein